MYSNPSAVELATCFIDTWNEGQKFVVLPVVYNGMPVTSVITPHSLQRSIDEYRACCLLAMRSVETANEIVELALDQIRSARLSVPFMTMLQKKFAGAFLREQWAIGRINRPYAELLRDGVVDAITWMPLPNASEFYADSFVAHVGSSSILLYEHLSYATNKGTIRARILNGASAGKEYALLDHPFHMSYPFVFKAEGRTWCMPEASASGTLTAYTLEDDPLRLVDPRIVMENVDIVDPTLFEHDGTWWLFASRASLGGNRCLCIWYASSPFGEWKEHEGNPVKIDVRSSRPAGGMKLVDGAIYRPSQDCSVSYGGSITINRIDILTTNEFRETPVQTLHPSHKWDRHFGLHTMCEAGDSTIIDVNRRMFSLAQLRSVIGL